MSNPSGSEACISELIELTVRGKVWWTPCRTLGISMCIISRWAQLNRLRKWAVASVIKQRTPAFRDQLFIFGLFRNNLSHVNKGFKHAGGREGGGRRGRERVRMVRQKNVLLPPPPLTLKLPRKARHKPAMKRLSFFHFYLLCCLCRDTAQKNRTKFIACRVY